MQLLIQTARVTHRTAIGTSSPESRYCSSAIAAYLTASAIILKAKRKRVSFPRRPSKVIFTHLPVFLAILAACASARIRDTRSWCSSSAPCRPCGDSTQRQMTRKLRNSAVRLKWNYNFQRDRSRSRSNNVNFYSSTSRRSDIQLNKNVKYSRPNSVELVENYNQLSKQGKEVKPTSLPPNNQK